MSTHTHISSSSLLRASFAYFIAEASLPNGFQKHKAVDLGLNLDTSPRTPNKPIQLDAKHE